MKHDLVVIGGGSAGLTASIFAAEAGLDTALVEQSPDDVGGECLRSGCVPSKTLLRIAQNIHDADNLTDIGLRVRGKPDWDAVKDEIQSVQETIRKAESPSSLRERDITTYFGTAAFTGRRSLQVDDTTVSADTIILATGTAPRTPSVQGIDKADTVTNETIFEMDELPDELLVVGGGPLGCELGQALNRLGSDVTIVERGSYLLGTEPVEASKRVRKSFEDEGINVFCDTDVTGFDEHTAYVTTANGERSLSFDNVLLATGRTPNTGGLGLDNAGITCDKQGHPEHDEYLQTTNPDVYVAGDLTGSYQFSHAAEYESTMIVKNEILPYFSKITYETMSHATYTDPVVASFGRSRTELDKEGIRYDVIHADFEHADKAIINDDDSWGEYYVTNRTFRGGIIVSDDAHHIIQELILAQQEDVKTTDIVNKIYPYPSIEAVTKHSVLNHLKDLLGDMTKHLIRFSYRYL
jgi:pyruvate/2-oxoglutarate dehydrogenase complex dihydrolipoamide dehydrogenase (E3) component